MNNQEFFNYLLNSTFFKVFKLGNKKSASNKKSAFIDYNCWN